MRMTSAAALAASALLTLSMAGAAQAAAPLVEARHAGKYHITSTPQEVSPEAAQLLRQGATPDPNSATAWSTPWAHWTPYAGGEVNDVRMHVYTGSDGHDIAYAEAYLNYNRDSVYLDVSTTSGNGHWPWKADHRIDTNGQVHLMTQKQNDGPGWYVRACGASFAVGDPWGNPQWGKNINCTAWN
ncbi:hypothetical protein OG523_00880 [Streptomyces virginiae]|uniref:hypothetical protein n=1 Tax=Streptomyces virginiae TaxID=1961 RepID=UPI002E32433F|nr:hypothetical protein [Streptomyces virginiae]